MKNLTGIYNSETTLRNHLATVKFNGNIETYNILSPNEFEAAKLLTGHLNLTGVRKIMTDIEIKEIS